MVVGVANRDPAAGVHVIVAGDADVVQNSAGHHVPLRVAESAVLRRGPYGAVPDMFGGPPVAELLDPQVEGGGEVLDRGLRVPARIGCEAVP
jgi:hypothetical protein